MEKRIKKSCVKFDNKQKDLMQFIHLKRFVKTIDSSTSNYAHIFSTWMLWPRRGHHFKLSREYTIIVNINLWLEKLNESVWRFSSGTAKRHKADFTVSHAATAILSLMIIIIIRANVFQINISNFSDRKTNPANKKYRDALAVIMKCNHKTNRVYINFIYPFVVHALFHFVLRHIYVLLSWFFPCSIQQNSLQLLSYRSG